MAEKRASSLHLYNWSGNMAEWLGALVALLEDQNLVFRTPNGWLITPVAPGDLMLFSGTTLITHVGYVHNIPHTYINKKEKQILKK